jgi:hypothetical protein
MMELRDQILRSSPEELGITAVGEAPYVAVMELAFPDAVVSVVTASTGDASLYFSTGGGVIGGIGHEPVRQAAIAFVSASANHLASFTPTTTLEHPGKGQVRFFIRTTGGIRSAMWTNRNSDLARTPWLRSTDVVKMSSRSFGSSARTLSRQTRDSAAAPQYLLVVATLSG